MGSPVSRYGYDGSRRPKQRDKWLRDEAKQKIVPGTRYGYPGSFGLPVPGTGTGYGRGKRCRIVPVPVPREARRPVQLVASQVGFRVIP